MSGDLQRFRSKYTVDPDGCWLWTDRLDNGYGRFWLEGRLLLAHRLSYQIHVGAIDDGLHLDHLCRNRACVNPAHLEPVTPGENVLRGIGLSAANRRKTTCLRGHALDGANLHIRKDTGARSCVTCQRQRVRDWRSKKAS